MHSNLKPRAFAVRAAPQQRTRRPANGARADLHYRVGIAPAPDACGAGTATAADAAGAAILAALAAAGTCAAPVNGALAAGAMPAGRSSTLPLAGRARSFA